MPLLYHFAVLIAWSGAAAFAASLLYLVYFYVVTLGSTGGSPADRLVHAATNVALFSVFALHHSLLARTAGKRLVLQLVPAHLERALYVWTASLLAIAMCAFWQPVAGLLYRIDGWWRAPFFALQMSGAVLALGAARAVSVRELAGVDQASGRSSAGEIKMRGPFGLVRHPIYLGWVLMVFATPTLTANRLLFASVSTIYLILAIPWEERSLVAVHGDRYRVYQQRVRWRLIPGVW